MNISTARMNAKQLIDFVPDDKILFIIQYIKNFASDKKSTPQINPQKKAAYEALLADVHPLKGKPLSLNGQEEASDIVLEKYESLN
ncbi:MAG: hypothetical protein IKR40_02215 [Treponema sp.]|nr:hypothetical protein [Treponema sp.]